MVHYHDIVTTRDVEPTLDVVPPNGYVVPASDVVPTHDVWSMIEGARNEARQYFQFFKIIDELNWPFRFTMVGDRIS